MGVAHLGVSLTLGKFNNLTFAALGGRKDCPLENSRLRNHLRVFAFPKCSGK